MSEQIVPLKQYLRLKKAIAGELMAGAERVRRTYREEVVRFDLRPKVVTMPFLLEGFSFFEGGDGVCILQKKNLRLVTRSGWLAAGGGGHIYDRKNAGLQ